MVQFRVYCLDTVPDALHGGGRGVPEDGGELTLCTLFRHRSSCTSRGRRGVPEDGGANFAYIVYCLDSIPAALHGGGRGVSEDGGDLISLTLLDTIPAALHGGGRGVSEDGGDLISLTLLDTIPAALHGGGR